MIEAIRKSLSQKNESLIIIGADSNKNSVAQHFVDEFWLMPSIEHLSVNKLISYCKSKDINMIFPTRDGELIFFSENLLIFQENGIDVMVSKKESLIHTRDKLIFFDYLNKKNFTVIPTFLDIERIKSSSFVVKERFGSGSKGLYLNVNKNEAKKASKNIENPIFQPFIIGTEYSIDVYVDKRGESKGAIVRERMAVVNGESQVTCTVRYIELEKLGMELAENLQLRGHVMFQVIVDEFGIPHIVECNPRFGGASTLSVKAGLDSFYWFMLETQGENLENYPFKRSEKELTLIRHAKDMIM